MHILVTRPEPDASQMRALLMAQGHTADIAPLLDITVTAPDEQSLAGISALVVTSRNGLRALERSEGLARLLPLPLLVVGRGTGAAARAMGFADVTVGPATAKDLVPLIIAAWRDKILPACCAPDAGLPGPVLHVAGDKISFDLIPPLAEAGIPLRRVTVYHSSPATRLPDAVKRCIAGRGYDGVLLMSPLSAQTYIHLVADAGLSEPARDVAYLCLSKGIADILAVLGTPRVLIAAKPNVEEMVVLVRNLAAQSAPLSPPGVENDNIDGTNSKV